VEGASGDVCEVGCFSGRRCRATLRHLRKREADSGELAGCTRGHLLGGIAERTRTATTSGLTRRVLSHHCKGIVAATLHLGCYNPPPLKKSHPEITKEERSLGKTKNGH
jgi:hypothetical protein